MASTADIRNGLMIRFNNDIYEIIEFLHVKPGKGGAFVRTKLKSVTTGKVLENTFPSGAKIDPVRVERRKFQYLYPEGDQYVFMNNETFDQINIDPHLVDSREFLMEGMECELVMDAENERVLAAYVPTFVTMTITYTEPGIKGDTATNALKPATVESGAEIKVPLFIDTGEKIKIDTREKKYVERVK
jgi:elongation factor P